MPYPMAAARGRSSGVVAGGAADIYTYLVSWWAMDEASDGSADVTRNDSHGTNHLASNFTVAHGTGLVGNAADLESANNEYLSIASNATLQCNNADFAVCGWINLESFASDYAAVANKGNEWYLGAQFGGNAKPYFQIGNGTALGNYAQYGGTVLSTATWYFIACWHDVSAKTIYISVNNGTVYSNTYTGDNTPDTVQLAIGRQASAATHKHDGLLDEWAYWKGYFPSAAERTWLYAAGSGRAYAAFAAQYGG